MKNITLSIDDDILKLGPEYARAQNVSFNVLVRRLIEHTVTKKSSQWLVEMFDYMDRNIDSNTGITWTRDELHRS